MIQKLLYTTYCLDHLDRGAAEEGLVFGKG